MEREKKEVEKKEEKKKKKKGQGMDEKEREWWRWVRSVWGVCIKVCPLWFEIKSLKGS